MSDYSSSTSNSILVEKGQQPASVQIQPVRLPSTAQVTPPRPSR